MGIVSNKALSVKALRLCQLSQRESQRIFSFQQELTAGCNGLPLWGSWREAPERARMLKVKHLHSDNFTLTKKSAYRCV